MGDDRTGKPFSLVFTMIAHRVKGMLQRPEVEQGSPTLPLAKTAARLGFGRRCRRLFGRSHQAGTDRSPESDDSGDRRMGEMAEPPWRWWNRGEEERMSAVMGRVWGIRTSMPSPGWDMAR